MKKICISIVAHVDSGKTTLCEAILYKTDKIRKFGNVDDRNTFFDNTDIEKKRKITIKSKSAGFTYKNTEFSLIDTPGHIDFAGEMERNLYISDYVILIVSAISDIGSYTEKILEIVDLYKKPVFIFINKTDYSNADKNKRIEELNKISKNRCVDFDLIFKDKNKFYEEIAYCSDKLLNSYLDLGYIEEDKIRDGINNREIYPVISGSALKCEGISELLDCIDCYSKENKKDKTNFRAAVYRIRYEDVKVTHIRILSGELSVKDVIGDEKVNQIRVYDGNNYKSIKSASAGDVCAIAGISNLKVGDIFNNEFIEENIFKNYINPIVEYSININENIDNKLLQSAIKIISDEEPELKIRYDNYSGNIKVRLSGELQKEIFLDRFEELISSRIDISNKEVVYKISLKNNYIGIGHYEPLKHYAEVHLLAKRGEEGVYSLPAEDAYTKNIEDIISNYVLNNFFVEFNNTEFVVLAHKYHQKHTEGGDFFEATVRAVYNSLAHAYDNDDFHIYEPYVKFKIKISNEYVGKVLSELEKLYADFEAPYIEGDCYIINGVAPAITFSDYITEFRSLCRGKGDITAGFKSYEICHNENEVYLNKIKPLIEANLFMANSVFCSHGSGTNVDYKKVDSMAHCKYDKAIYKYLFENDAVENYLYKKIDYINSDNNFMLINERSYDKEKKQTSKIGESQELIAIFESTYGKIKDRRVYNNSVIIGEKPEKEYVYNPSAPKIKEILIDAYNIIFCDSELKELANKDMEAARSYLIDMMKDYSSYTDEHLILVFDSYKNENYGQHIKVNDKLSIVYTEYKETADRYIESYVRNKNNDKKSIIYLASSDLTMQTVVRSLGGLIIGSGEFLNDIKACKEKFLQNYRNIRDKI